ncbi:MAG TPA: ABC transporter ATP-binding protein, partial [Acidobacteriota bacterium]|nr:ABC transporter ATP-binding protein [Acidobacteriota bacterium]
MNTDAAPDQAPIRDWRQLLRLLAYVRRRWLLAAASVLLMLVFNVAGVAEPYLVKLGIDRDVAAGDFAGLQRTALWLGLLMVVGLVCQFLFNYAVQSLGQRLLLDLRMDLFRKVLDLSKDYYDKTAAGRTLTNVTNDVESIREFISEGIVSVVGDLLKVGMIFVAMLVIDLKLALMAFVTLPVFILATALFRRSIRSGFRGVRKANAEINTSLNETISGIREIRLFRIRDKFAADFAVHNRNYRDAYLKTIRAYALYFPVLEGVSTLGMMLTLFAAHTLVGVELRVGVIFAFFAYINMFFRPLREMAEQFNTFQSAMAATERVLHLLDQPVSVQNPAAPAPLPERFAGALEFRDVTFAYDPEAPVLQNFSCQIRPGERVALVGYTGSGKTTVISLLNRLYDVTGGAITIDGTDIRALPVRALRRRIATIPQDVFLFTGSVAENIGLHQPDIGRDRIEAAAREALLHPFIEAMPHRYDENVLEQGRLLSAGQRQLLSFARALVRAPDIVVLDEATANIDSATEHLVEEAIHNLLRGRTAIIIAHRLSTIREVDRILVLHKGRLAEEGTHD